MSLLAKALHYKQFPITLPKKSIWLAASSHDCQCRLLAIKPVFDIRKQRTNVPPEFALERAAPDHADAPARLSKRLACRSVMMQILTNLSVPEGLVRQRPFEQIAAVTMPKTAVDKKNSMAGWKHYIRFAR